MVIRLRLSDLDRIGDNIQEESEHYFKMENGNWYNKHCFYIMSGPLTAQQIHKSLAEAFGHGDGFYVNTVRNSDGQLQNKSYFWVDDDEECYKLFANEVVLPPVKLSPQQQRHVRYKSDLFYITYTPKFYNRNPSAGDNVATQLFVGKLPRDNTNVLREMLTNMFSRYAVSGGGKIEVAVSPCKDGMSCYAIVTFNSYLDCSFAIDMTHRCVIQYKGQEYTLSIRNAKIGVETAAGYTSPPRYEDIDDEQQHHSSKRGSPPPYCHYQQRQQSQSQSHTPHCHYQQRQHQQSSKRYNVTMSKTKF